MRIKRASVIKAPRTEEPLTLGCSYSVIGPLSSSHHAITRVLLPTEAGFESFFLWLRLCEMFQ